MTRLHASQVIGDSMTEDEKKRLDSIREKVNLLEQLHKTCQLDGLGLQPPILNESRYLARALVDALSYDNNPEKRNDALSRAELAVASAINDAIDILVLFCQRTCKRIEDHYPDFNIVDTVFGDEYITTLTALQTIGALIVHSRGHRHERSAIYAKLGDEFAPELITIASFSLKLRSIEEQAKASNTSRNAAHALLQNMFDSLQQGSAKHGFQLYLQGKFENTPQRILIGAEALLRFKLGEQTIPPSNFIPIAESSGLIAPIGQWVLKQVVDLLAKQPNLPPISINLTAQELLSPNFADDTLSLLKATGVAAERIEFEVTERTAIDNLQAVQQIASLFKNGCKISIDDFGTGATRFDYLAELPIQIIKIDMSLVRKLKADPDKYTRLLQAINAVAQVCNLKLVAEGIEDEASLQQLSEIGIQQFQGYYFEKPMPAGDFIAKHFGQGTAPG